MSAPKYVAIHEAAHAVMARVLGGYAEGISLIAEETLGVIPGCRVAWPADGDDWTREKLIVAAAGPAATAIYRHCSLDAAIWTTGTSDWHYMKKLGSTDISWFREASRLCRRHWPAVLAVANAARPRGHLCEAEIVSAMKGAP